MREQPHYTDLLTKDFFELYYEQKKMSFPKIRDLLRTQGHNIATGTIYKYAKKLGFGRSIASAKADLDYSKTFMTEEIIEAVDGFLLGDGGIHSTANSPSARLRCGVEHEEFCFYMINQFKSYMPKVRIVKDNGMNQGFIWNGSTKHHPDIQKQYLRWYPEINGKRTKQPPCDVRITPKSVMLWYLGDGSLSVNNKTNTISIQLSTDSFLSERVEMLVEELNKINVFCHRTKGNRIRVDAKGISGFFDFIGKKSPILCYDYKFDRVPKWRFSSKRISEVAEEIGISYDILLNLVQQGQVGCYRASKKGKPRLLPEHVKQARNITKKDYNIDYNSIKGNSMKQETIVLRTDSEEHNIIKSKSSLFGQKKSAFIRNACFSYWPQSVNGKSFKQLLKKYQEGSQEERQTIVNILFQYYRQNGYPHNILTDEQKIKRMRQLRKTTCKLNNKKEISRNYIALDLVNSFHPHMMQVRYAGQDTPYDRFHNDEGLKDCIIRWMELKKYPNPSGIRRILRTRNGVKSTVNFKPAVAKFIYERYAVNNGNVLDPCAGFSGRLAGCIASSKNLHYYGIDPDCRTARGNMECASFFCGVQNNLFEEREFKFGFTFDIGCAEDVMENYRDNYFDLVFTSPPYYSTEEYASDGSQSMHRYSSYEEWKKNFLFKICIESLRVLKTDGYFVMNLKNYSNYKIADDFKTYCCRKGFTFIEQLGMILSNNEFNRDESSYHTEPLIVLRK